MDSNGSLLDLNKNDRRNCHMEIITDANREAKRTLNRIFPRLQYRFRDEIKKDSQRWSDFQKRLDENFPKLFSLYFDLYGGRYDFFFHIEDLLTSITSSWFSRSDELRNLDKRREQEPLWFQSNNMLGGVCYTDLFAINLEGIRSKIPYFKELGLTYLHLMPLFDSPNGENDGGYAVSDYRTVNPTLGTMKQLASLAHDLREEGISLALDFVFNHTSDEHLWARKARAGETEYEEYYRIFPDRDLPDAYEQNLREIFPDKHSGAFTLHPQLNKWVWTTFNTYQWDLNYENPVVFNRMADEMLFIANQGVEILRLDAVAFIWKELGTDCENLPYAHKLIQAYNSVARIAAPALLFKSEAIVHPDEVVRYIAPDQCQISYNPLLMALLWNTLATRQVDLLAKSLEERFHIDMQTSWVNYVRVHDDIGWTFSDEDAAALGINAGSHRAFLNDFYRGRFPGSFARGIPFQENHRTGDCRISGTCASLAGLEKALDEEGPIEVELAIRRINLLHGIILTVGGIPLLYLGDEIGTLNDYAYLNNPAYQFDSRWVHRSEADWDRYELRNDPSSIEGRVYQGLMQLIKLRKSYPGFSTAPLNIIHGENEHVLCFTRANVVIFANFSETAQIIPLHVLEKYVDKHVRVHGISEVLNDKDLTIEPLDFLVLNNQVLFES